ncbi:MAG: sugar phosphate isomerase/epimerase family protein [Panacibacter sp.]
MRQSTRRNFLKTSTGLLGFAIAGSSFDYFKHEPLLSFSTLGCPDWPFEMIVNFAVENNYNGIEMRGILRELELTKCKEFNSAENRAATLKLMTDKGLRFVDLGSSAAMHHPKGADRQKNIDDAKRFIDLAQQIKCPYIRVFPNDLPKDRDRNETSDLITKGLIELGNYAKDSNVTVLMESHGELVHTEDLKKIMEAAAGNHVGMIWDIVNMWSVTKEPPAHVYTQLKKYIHHTHIKDMKQVDGKEKYVLLGKGETPILEAIGILFKDQYKGYYSFEWEKLWHPEIDEPEIAIADYSKTMKEHFKV